VFVAIQLIILNRCVLYPVWNHCCKWPNYDLCILQGSVPTVLEWGNQNWSHVC